MNYYGAREKEDHSGWHYTCRNDDRIWPVGRCTSCPPHSTREEAEECYRQYLLDTRLDLNGVRMGDQQRKCAECGGWTDCLATIDHIQSVILCDAHRTREVFERHWQFAPVVASSY